MKKRMRVNNRFFALNDILTVGQFAYALNLHPDTVRRWANAGKIEYTTTKGKHRRFSIEELYKIINGAKVIA